MAPSSCPAAVRSDRMRKRCCSPHPPCGLPAVKEPIGPRYWLQKRTASSLHASRWRPMRYSNSPGRSSLKAISRGAWGTWPSENISPEVRWKYSSPVFSSEIMALDLVLAPKLAPNASRRLFWVEIRRDPRSASPRWHDSCSFAGSRPCCGSAVAGGTWDTSHDPPPYRLW